MRSYYRAALVALLAAMAVTFGLSSPASAHDDAAYAGWQRGFDFAWSKPSAQQVLNAGGSYVAVYISPSSSSGKHVSPAQVSAYRAAGLKVVPIYETSAGRALGGCSAGQIDAQRVNAALAKFGLPRETVVYSGAIDFDATSRQLGLVASYLDCQVAIRGGKDLVGVYGSYRVIEKANWWGYTRLWQTYAWSGGKWSGAADLRQVHNGYRLAGNDTDIDYTTNIDNVGYIGATGSAPAPAPVITPPADPANPYSGMPVVRYGARGANARAVQGALFDRGWRISVDGSFGPRTLSIVKQFQREHGLRVDGVVGPATWRCLYTCPVT